MTILFLFSVLLLFNPKIPKIFSRSRHFPFSGFIVNFGEADSVFRVFYRHITPPPLLHRTFPSFLILFSLEYKSFQSICSPSVPAKQVSLQNTPFRVHGKSVTPVLFLISCFSNSTTCPEKIVPSSLSSSLPEFSSFLFAKGLCKPIFVLSFSTAMRAPIFSFLSHKPPQRPERFPPIIGIMEPKFPCLPGSLSPPQEVFAYPLLHSPPQAASVAPLRSDELSLPCAFSMCCPPFFLSLIILLPSGGPQLFAVSTSLSFSCGSNYCAPSSPPFAGVALDNFRKRPPPAGAKYLTVPRPHPPPLVSFFPLAPSTQHSYSPTVDPNPLPVVRLPNSPSYDEVALFFLLF